MLDASNTRPLGAGSGDAVVVTPFNVILAALWCTIFNKPGLHWLSKTKKFLKLLKIFIIYPF